MKKDDAKIRVLVVARMLRKDRLISVPEILEELERSYDIQANRKTIYSDLRSINRVIPIEAIPGKNGGYRIADVLGRCDNGS